MPLNIETKWCPACETNKPVTEFSPASMRGKPCLASYCKPCNSRKGSEWAKANREKRNAYRKKWRQENPEKAKKADKRGHELDLQRNPDLHKKTWMKRKESGYAREYERANKERLREARRIWWAKNPDKANSYWRWQNFLRTKEGQKVKAALDTLKQLTEKLKDGDQK